MGGRPMDQIVLHQIVQGSTTAVADLACCFTQLDRSNLQRNTLIRWGDGEEEDKISGGASDEPEMVLLLLGRHGQSDPHIIFLALPSQNQISSLHEPGKKATICKIR